VPLAARLFKVTDRLMVVCDEAVSFRDPQPETAPTTATEEDDGLVTTVTPFERVVLVKFRIEFSALIC